MYQKCRSLKEEHFVGLHDVGKLSQASFHLTHIRNQHVDDGTPSLNKKATSSLEVQNQRNDKMDLN